MALTREEIIEAISTMSVLELSELVRDLQDKFGVSAAAMPMMGMAPMAQAETAQEAPQEEEKSEYTVVLMSSGDKKIQVIKVVREVTNLALKDAKTLVDESPSNVKESISKQEAEEIKTKLEAAGATVELK